MSDSDHSSPKFGITGKLRRVSQPVTRSKVINKSLKKTQGGQDINPTRDDAGATPKKCAQPIQETSAKNGKGLGDQSSSCRKYHKWDVWSGQASR